MWDTATGQPLGPPFSDGGSDVALSPNGQRVALAPFGNGSSSTPSPGTKTATLQSHGDFMRFTDDDRLAVSGMGRSPSSTPPRGPWWSERRTTCGCDLALSPDGRTVATGLDGPGLYALDGRELLADALDAPVLTDFTGFTETGVSADSRRLSVAAYGAGTVVLERDGDGWRTLRTTPGVLGVDPARRSSVPSRRRRRHRVDRRPRHRRDRARVPRPRSAGLPQPRRPQQ